MPFFKEIEHAARTDVGIKRSHNQDAFTVQVAPDRDVWSSVGHLFIVADGMGGHAVGEKASAKAVQEIPLTYVKHAQEGPAGALRKAFLEANAGINAIGTSNPEFRGLGTTATALVLRDEGAWIGHVGDSRAYRIRGGMVQQLSYDHSYAWEMARRLGVPPEEFADVKKNIIVRSLGPDPLVQVDVEGPYPLEDGDTFVLCSDGLSNLVTPEEVGALTTIFPVDEAAKFMIELANLRGGPDNITVLIVRVGNTKDSFVRPPESARSKLGRRIRGAATSFNRFIPWPITLLLAAFVLAVLFVIFSLNGIPGATWLVIGSGMLVVIGVPGLIMHSRKEPVIEETVEEIPTKASIHRQYPVRIDSAFCDQWSTLALQVKEQLEAKESTVDWNAYRFHAEAGARMSQEGDVLTASRSNLRALAVLAAVYNRDRVRGEGFKPKWETPEAR